MSIPTHVAQLDEQISHFLSSLLPQNPSGQSRMQLFPQRKVSILQVLHSREKISCQKPTGQSETHLLPMRSKGLEQDVQLVASSKHKPQGKAQEEHIRFEVFPNFPGGHESTQLDSFRKRGAEQLLHDIEDSLDKITYLLTNLLKYL